MLSLSRQADSAQHVLSLEMNLKVFSGRYSSTAPLQRCWDMGHVTVPREVLSHSQSANGERPWQEYNPKRH